MLPLKNEYREFLPGILHFAAHSHHPRPLVTLGATMQCWDDAAATLDSKWDHIFGSVVPEAQRNVAELLSYDYPSHIAFAPNTHELVARILSSFDPHKPLRILTTTSEFHSFTRQMNRLRERGNVSVTQVGVLPDYKSFPSRFVEEASQGEYDLIFFSHVFFDSGFRIKQNKLRKMVEEIAEKSDATIVIDGYHGFCAVPTILQGIQHRVFYLAGGYKYAQWGEGACFLAIPKGCTLRPENTGWFAEYGALSSDSAPTDVTRYSDDGFRFWGSTFDPAGLYRLIAVTEWLREKNIDIQMIRTHVEKLQWRFLDLIDHYETTMINKQSLVIKSDLDRGNFLSFDLGSGDKAATFERALREHGVVVDSRGPYLRIGFGMYQSKKDVDGLIKRIRAVEKSLEETIHA